MDKLRIAEQLVKLAKEIQSGKQFDVGNVVRYKNKQGVVVGTSATRGVQEEVWVFFSEDKVAWVNVEEVKSDPRIKKSLDWTE